MVAPVTGPITTSSGSGYELEDTKIYYRQKRPYDLVLPYTRTAGAVLLRHGIGAESVTATRCRLLAQSPDTYTRDKSWNLARSRWLEAIGPAATVGIDLAQGRQAMGMITRCLGRLNSFNRGLRNLDAKLVARSLGIAERRSQHVLQNFRIRNGLPKRVRRDPYGRVRQEQVRDLYERDRGLADLWLSFWFGLKPTVTNIFDSMEVLDAPFLSTRTKGSGKSVSVRQFGGDYPATEIIKQVDTYTTRFGGQIEVTNPNLRLAQQLGVLNPATVAFDLIPWSFVFGWFCNIQSYLSSFTDFAGLTIHKGYLIQVTDSRLDFTWRPCVMCSEAEANAYANAHHTGIARIYSRQALGDIPRPRVQLSTFGLSPLRALTSISLLVQQLPKAR